MAAKSMIHPDEDCLWWEIRKSQCMMRPDGRLPINSHPRNVHCTPRASTYSRFLCRSPSPASRVPVPCGKPIMLSEICFKIRLHCPSRRFVFCPVLRIAFTLPKTLPQQMPSPAPIGSMERRSKVIKKFIDRLIDSTGFRKQRARLGLP